jgi:hypothetical protein
MANRADVSVKNEFTTHSVKISRKLQDGTEDFSTTLASSTSEQVNLPSTDVSLVIEAPTGLDLKLCSLNIDTEVDLNVIYSRTLCNWILSIIPNELPPEVPTTVNVTVRDIEPD